VNRDINVCGSAPSEQDQRGDGAASASIAIDVDVSSVEADLALLAQAADASGEVRQRLLCLLDAGVKLVRVDTEALVAPGARELTYRAQLSDGLADLVAAVRAGNV